MEQLLSVAEEMNGNRTGTITDIGTDNSEHMEMIASEVKAGKDPIVNFNQDSKVIVKHKESPDTRNNLTKLCVDDLLSTTVPLKTRNKPERLFTVNVINSGDALQVRTDAILQEMFPSEQRATLISMESFTFSVIMIVLSLLAGIVFSVW